MPGVSSSAGRTLPAGTADPPPVWAARRGGVVAAVTSLVVAVALCVHYAGVDGPDRLDVLLRGTALAGWFSRRPALALEIVHVGAPLAVATTAALLAALCLALGQRRGAVLLVVGVGLSGGAAVLLKPLVGRTYDGAVTFPSGHTSGIAAVMLATALLVTTAARRLRRWVAVGTATAALSVVALMGVALVAVGAHFPTDVIGGFLVAVSAVSAVAVVLGSRPAVSRADAPRRTGGPGPSTR